jgi:hypothetical protein
MEQRVISTFRKAIETREYVMSFPQDAHIQEMWDFVQEIANHLIEVNKRNMALQEQNAEVSGEQEKSVEPVSEVVTPEIVGA